jgi:hypothetical protein
MEACGAVALNYEAMSFALLNLWRGFGGLGKTALAFVFVEGHDDIVKKLWRERNMSGKHARKRFAEPI